MARANRSAIGRCTALKTEQISQWSTAKSSSEAPDAAALYPTAALIERGRKLAAELERAGVDCWKPLRRAG